MKTFDIAKTIIHLIIATLLFIFSKSLVSYVPYLVSSIMFLYFLETLYEAVSEKNKDERIERFFEAVLLMILISIMLVYGRGIENLEKAAIIWALWNILREGSEIVIKARSHKYLVVKMIDFTESVIIIVFSYFLIGNPTAEYELFTHIIILGTELIVSGVLPLTDIIDFKKIVNKKVG